MRVLVGIAALNDEEGLAKILPQMSKKIGGHWMDVIVVDDGSTDRTTEIARALNCFVLSHPNKMGHGMARRRTLQFAVSNDYDLVITMDGDGQHDPTFLPKFIEAFEKGYQLVRASRFHPLSPKDPLPPQWLELNQRATDEINRVTGWKLTDGLCGMMGFPVSIVREILPELRYEDYGYIIEMLLRVRSRFPDIRVVEIPHPAIYRGTGKLQNVYSGDLTARIQRFNEHFQQIEQLSRELGLV